MLCPSLREQKFLSSVFLIPLFDPRRKIESHDFWVSAAWKFRAGIPYSMQGPGYSMEHQRLLWISFSEVATFRMYLMRDAI